MESAWRIFVHSLQGIKKPPSFLLLSLVGFFCFVFFYALQLVKCVEFSWDNLCFINWVDKINWPPWRVETKKSSVQKLKKSFGKKFLNSLGWPIQIINSVDETEFSYCITDWRNTAVLQKLTHFRHIISCFSSLRKYETESVLLSENVLISLLW